LLIIKGGGNLWPAGSTRKQELDVEQQQEAALQGEAAQAEDADQPEVAASVQGLNAQIEANGEAAAAETSGDPLVPSKAILQHEMPGTNEVFEE